MKTKQSSFLWLLLFEAKILWRGSILVRTHKYVIGPVIFVGLFFQTVALILAWQIVHHPIPHDEMLMAANLNLFFFATLMLTRALTAAIDVLYSRGDVDFLLASPIPPGRVLAVRMLGVAASVAAPWTLLGGVLANALIIFGQFWALAVYPMLFATGMVASAVAFSLVVFLVGIIGPAAARRSGHTLALFAGVFIFALGQAPRFVGQATMYRLWTSFLPGANDNGLQWLFGRGLLGEPLPLLASLLLTIAVFTLVWAGLDKKFANGAISAAAYRPPGTAGRQTGSFRPKPGQAIFMKNLRLLVRFPGVVSQTVYRSLTLVPVVMILIGGKFQIGGSVYVVVPLLVFLAGQLGLFFISVMVGSDDSPELAATAPVSRLLLKRAALGAAAYATIIIMAVPVFGTALRAGNLLPVLAVGMAGVMVSNILLGFRFPSPLIRANFGKASTGTMLGLVLGVGTSSLWSLAAWLLVAPHPLAWLTSQ
jgi:ABC-2 type transport system permease protein